MADLPFLDQRFDAAAVFPVVRASRGSFRLDYLSQQWVDRVFATGLRALTPYAGLPMTTLSYNAYGNQSAWRLINLFNGSLDGCDYTPGQVLRMPEINDYLADPAPAATVGTVVEL